MKLADRIVCTLWVERSASICRLATLCVAPRPLVYRAVYGLCLRGLVVHPRPKGYELTEMGRVRADVILAVDLFRQTGTAGRTSDAA